MGANMTIANKAGEIPRDIARRFAQLACVKMLGGEPGKQFKVLCLKVKDMIF